MLPYIYTLFNCCPISAAIFSNAALNHDANYTMMPIIPWFDSQGAYFSELKILEAYQMHENYLWENSIKLYANWTAINWFLTEDI